MDALHLRQRVLHSVAASQRLLGRHGPHGSLLEAPGYTAAVVPPLADATLVNGAVILDPQALPQALHQLTTTYHQAGVTRWGVLLAPDAEATQALVQAGLRPEAQPAAMAADLAELAEPASPGQPNPNGLPPIHPTTFATAGRINDFAYGHPDDRMEVLIRDFPPHAAHTYSVDHADEPASVALVTDHDSDAAVAFVATVPWAQRLGLASHILRHALQAAKQRGATTSTLIASPMGRDLYTALGYRDVGHFELWQYSRRA